MISGNANYHTFFNSSNYLCVRRGLKPIHWTSHCENWWRSANNKLARAHTLNEIINSALVGDNFAEWLRCLTLINSRLVNVRCNFNEACLRHVSRNSNRLMCSYHLEPVAFSCLEILIVSPHLEYHRPASLCCEVITQAGLKKDRHFLHVHTHMECIRDSCT